MKLYLSNILQKDWYIIILIASLYSVIVVLTQWSMFSISYPISEYEARYSRSQYVLGEGRSIVMGDGDIYTYAGIRYVQGEDVTKINFEHTPFIKYLFGVSYFVTGKPNWVIIPLIYIAIVAFWYLAKEVIYPVWGRYLALALFLGHSTVYKHIPQTMLDFPMTAVLLAVTVAYCHIYKDPHNIKLILFGVLSGLLLLSKYPFPLLSIYIGLLFIYLVVKGISIGKLYISFLFMIITYLFGYISYFLNGHSLIDFIRFEWWRWQWFSGKVDSPKGMIWQTIFLGRYPKWWDFSGDYINIGHWNILWPLTFMLYVASWIKPIRKKFSLLFPYKIWIAFSLIAYSLGVAEDRFLVPLIPGFAIFGTQFLIYIRRGFIQKQK